MMVWITSAGPRSAYHRHDDREALTYPSRVSVSSQVVGYATLWQRFKHHRSWACIVGAVVVAPLQGLHVGDARQRRRCLGGDVGHMSCCGPLLYLGMTCRCVHVRCLFGTVLGERVMACRREFQVASRFRPRDIRADPLLCEGFGIPLCCAWFSSRFRC